MPVVPAQREHALATATKHALIKHPRRGTPGRSRVQLSGQTGQLSAFMGVFSSTDVIVLDLARAAARVRDRGPYQAVFLPLGGQFVITSFWPAAWPRCRPLPCPRMPGQRAPRLPCRRAPAVAAWATWSSKPPRDRGRREGSRATTALFALPERDSAVAKLQIRRDGRARSRLGRPWLQRWRA